MNGLARNTMPCCATAHLQEVGRFEATINTVSTLTGRNLEPWRALLATAAWLTDKGVDRLLGRMMGLSVAYQKERTNTETGDLTVLVIRTLGLIIGQYIKKDWVGREVSVVSGIYVHSYNNPVNYTDPSGHCIDGLTTWACIAIGLKIVDYGWTAYDTWQAGRTLADPYATSEAKMMAGLTVGLAVIFEAIEPDDFLPVGLPADDVARRAIVSGAREALEEGGPEALEGFLREQLGDHADTALAKLDELLGIGDVRFLEKPGQLGHIFRNEAGHLAEDTLTNRNLLLGTVSGKNFVKADSFGNQWYARLLDDGAEAWVQVRNGIIQNGGVNLEPLYLH